MKKFTAMRWPIIELNFMTVIRELQRELLKYVLVEATVNGTTQVQHLLDRQPIGWVIVDKGAAVDIYRSAWDTKTITLNSASSVSCKILIF